MSAYSLIFLFFALFIPSEAVCPVESLNSLEFFRSSRMWFPSKSIHSAEEFRQFYQDMKRSSAQAFSRSREYAKLRGEENSRLDSSRLTLLTLPLVMEKAGHLFRAREWSESDRQLGIEVSRVVADLLQRPALEMHPLPTSDAAFCRGLTEVARAFNSLFQNDTLLASMLFTVDNGPLWGAKVHENDFNRKKIILVDSALIPDQGRLLLWESDSSTVLSFQPSNRAKPWSIQLTGSGNYPLKDVHFVDDDTVEPIQDVGYKVHLLVNGEYCHLYVDEQGRFRFYFLSW